MPLTVVSWNIQKLTAEKLVARLGPGGVAMADLIAQTAGLVDADLLLLMELRRTAACDIYQQSLESLNAMQQLANPAMVWLGFQSEATGKRNPLPPYFSLPKTVDAPDYAEVLRDCYHQGQTPKGNGWLLNPPNAQSNIDNVVKALEMASILRPDMEEYGVFFRCDKGTDPNSLWWSTPAGIGLSRGSSGARSRSPLDGELGYQSPTSSFNGRCPCLVQLIGGSPTAPCGIPLLVFHAPFSNMAARVQANRLLPYIGAWGGAGTTFVRFAPLSIICGDFNVDLYPVTASSSVRTYQNLEGAGYEIGIWEPSTLRAKVDPGVANSMECRSSAYDNILVNPLGCFVGQARIYDVIGSLVAGNYRLGVMFDGPNPIYAAYMFFRKQVSDHLPACATINM